MKFSIISIIFLVVILLSSILILTVARWSEDCDELHGEGNWYIETIGGYHLWPSVYLAPDSGYPILRMGRFYTCVNEPTGSDVIILKPFWRLFGAKTQ